jgi:hypothetical protein
MCSTVASDGTSSSYTLQSSDTGQFMVVEVTAANGAGSAASAVASTATAAVVASGGGSPWMWGGSTASGIQVALDPNANQFYEANTDGSGLTNFAADPSQTLVVANDQVGDIYVTDGSGDILLSAGGATPVSYITDACPAANNTDSSYGDGAAADYQVSAMAFTPDGSQGAWFCQDEGAQNNFGDWDLSNGYVVYWNGTTTSVIYNGLGSTSGHPEELAISPDGSTVVYRISDDNEADYATNQGGFSGSIPPEELYAIPTNTVTAPGAAPVLDNASDGRDGDDGGRSWMAFVNNGADVVYNVSNGSTLSIYEAPVDGSGSPTVLVPSVGGDELVVVGSDDSAGNGFECAQLDGGLIGQGGTVQTGLCDSSGVPGDTIDTPTFPYHSNNPVGVPSGYSADIG